MRLSRRGALHSAGKGAVEVTFTGNYTDTVIQHNGAPWRLITMMSSGVVEADREFEAYLWLCNGGYDGAGSGSNNSGGMGAKFLPGQLVKVGKRSIVTVGAGNNGETAFAEFVATTRGSGAGRGTRGTERIDGALASVGGGVPTVPFGDGDNFERHCAGGAGGITTHGGEYEGDPTEYGGDGGTNGGDGEGASYTGTWGKGGEKGGASFGSYNYNYRPKDATFYGSGGSGRGLQYYLEPGAHSSLAQWIGGYNSKGYQGVLYLLIPLAA